MLQPLVINSDMPIPKHNKETIDESVTNTTTITYFLDGNRVAQQTIVFVPATNITTRTMFY